MLKNGVRLKSQVDATQVIIVRTTEGLDDLRCGGHLMVPLTDDRTAELDPNFAAGTVMGRRYVHENGTEILVTKAGTGTLTIGDTALELKQAKPLPASD